MSAFDIPKESVMAKERQARVTTDTSMRTDSIIISTWDESNIAKMAKITIRNSNIERIERFRK